MSSVFVLVIERCVVVAVQFDGIADREHTILRQKDPMVVELTIEMM